MNTFSSSHLSTILKYGGISFIAGAVNHGFFSESRSLWTAGFGVLFYVLGAWLEMRTVGGATKSWRDVLGAGIVFSIGIGFFTGGLQHFPDSPDRSLWVVPLGFTLSVVAMHFMDGSGADASKASKASRQQALLYGLVASLLVVAGSALAWRVLDGQGHGGQHGDGHSHSHAAAPAAVANPAAATREIAIDMLDHMRFTPDQLQVKQGETIRFKVKNSGKMRHEWVIGNEQELQAHAKEMQSMKAGHKHDMANAISLGAGEQDVLTWTFDKAGLLAMACFEPGHYEAGMRGKIVVLP